LHRIHISFKSRKNGIRFLVRYGRFGEAMPFVALLPADANLTRQKEFSVFTLYAGVE